MAHVVVTWHCRHFQHDWMPWRRQKHCWHVKYSHTPCVSGEKKAEQQHRVHDSPTGGVINTAVAITWRSEQSTQDWLQRSTRCAICCTHKGTHRLHASSAMCGSVLGSADGTRGCKDANKRGGALESRSAEGEHCVQGQACDRTHKGAMA